MKDHHTFGKRMMVLVCILSLLVCCFAVGAYAVDGDIPSPAPTAGQDPSGAQNPSGGQDPSGAQNPSGGQDPSGAQNPSGSPAPIPSGSPAPAPSDSPSPAPSDSPSPAPTDPAAAAQIEVTVVWEHGDNAEDKQPTSADVTVNGETKTASAENEWKVTFDVSDTGDNTPEAGEVTDYTADVKDTAPDKFTVTYTYKSVEPSSQPSDQPTASPAASDQPTASPAASDQPTASPAASDKPANSDKSSGSSDKPSGSSNKPSGSSDKPSGSSTSGSASGEASGEQPKTGDENEPIVWAVLTGTLLAAMVAVVVIAKKKQVREK